VRAVANELTRELGGRSAASARRDGAEISTIRGDGPAARRRSLIRILGV
jgi:hypothetical protein